MDPKVIAFYLPQFYPFKENDEWWGKGFTEWTNVGKAKPLFKGHLQPRVPADLGYYDLRLPEVREQQAELAREAGVHAFCYWHYWFGNGKRLLERVFDEVLESGKPDFPFCLGWANHSWYAKRWNKDVSEDKLLIEQTYPGIDDAKMHFDYLLKAFRDSRYVKVEGKPFFLVFAPNQLPQLYLEKFRLWAKEAGFPDMYIVANIYEQDADYQKYIIKGYDAVVINRLGNFFTEDLSKHGVVIQWCMRLQRYMSSLIRRRPRGAMNYQKYFNRFISYVDRNEDVLPVLLPQWDHSPRSGDKAQVIYYNAKPEFFYQHVRQALEAVKKKNAEHQLLILKSWNEWGEGNFLEPDIVYGKGFINALRSAIDDFK